MRDYKDEVTVETLQDVRRVVESLRDTHPEAVDDILARLRSRELHPNVLKTRVIDTLLAHPHWPVAKIAEATGASTNFIYHIRQEQELSPIARRKPRN